MIKEFVKGKWYKNPGDFKGADKIFAKFDYYDNGRQLWYYSGKVILQPNGKKELYSKGSWHFSKNSEPYEPLTEGQLLNVLPEDHPDYSSFSQFKFLL